MAILDDLPEELKTAFITNDEERGNLENLVRQIQSKAGVIPFVGAGLSAAFGLPTWRDFLRNVAGFSENPKIKARVDGLLTNNRYEEAAEVAYRSIKEIRFNQAVDSAYGSRTREIDWNRKDQAVYELPLLGDNPVVTTNFDGILERVFSDQGHAFEHVVNGAQVQEVTRAQDRGERYLLKLHGDVLRANARVLTQSEYAAVYGSPKANQAAFDDWRTYPLPALLLDLLKAHSFLFLGCGLTQDRTLIVLQRAKVEVIALPRHFAVVERPESGRLRNDRTDFLTKRLIAPIYYPAGKYGCITGLLRYLVVKRRQAVGAQPQPELQELHVCESVDFVQPHLCDRNDQVNRFTGVVPKRRSDANPQRPTGQCPARVFLLQGEKEACPDSFIRRLRDYEFQERGYDPAVTQTISITTWGDENIALSLRDIKTDLYKELGVYDEFSKTKDTDLQHLYALLTRTGKSVFVIVHHLYEVNWNECTFALVRDYLRYWRSLPPCETRGDICPLEFFCFLVVHLPKIIVPEGWLQRQYAQRRFDKRWPRYYIDQRLKDLERELREYPLSCILPPLHNNVHGIRHITEWWEARLKERGEALPQGRVMQCRNKLQAFIDRDDWFPMAEVLPVLQEAYCLMQL